MKEKHL